MKIHRILSCAAVVALSPLALAELPITGQALGTVQGTIDFCARIKPEAAGTLQQFARLLVQGASEEEVAKLRDTDEYKAAYESIRSELDQVTESQAAESCAGYLEHGERS